jgi:hypothetical protein
MVSFKSRHLTSLLGLTLEGKQLEGLVLARSSGAFKIVRSFKASLSLDPLTNDPELVGREIRNQLEANGIHERRCAVCIPLQWALTLQTKVPDLPEQDLPGYFQIEAERGFPYSPDDLSTAVSRYRAPNGEQHASLIAVPKSHLALLEKTLRAARLKPLSFSLGIAAMHEPSEEPEVGLLTLAVGDNCVELEVAIKGGVAALRTLEGAIEAEGTERHVDPDLVAREVRITLGQLPKELRELVSRIRVFGRADLTGPLIKELTPIARDMGLLVDLGAPPRVEGYDPQQTNQAGMTAALSLAARFLGGAPTQFEFLPPRQSPITQFAAKFSSARVLYAGASAGAVALIIVGFFSWQQWKLSSLESKWNSMKPRVNEVTVIRDQTRKFRSWFDESARSLRILRQVTEAFPEDGTVTAKNLKIKDLTDISFSGLARNSQAISNLLVRMGQDKQIVDLKTPNVRGTPPALLQFDLNFRWSEGASREN